MQNPREGWRGAILVGLSLLGVVLCVCASAVVVLADRVPRQLDRYAMTRTGEAGLYRVTYRDGSQGFLTVNVVRPDADSLSYTAVLAEGSRAVQANYRFTNWQGSGQPYTRIDTLARRGNQLLLLAQRLPGSLEFPEPAIDAWPAGLLQTNAGAAIEGQTQLYGQDWTYRQWLDGSEAWTLPDGSAATAERVKIEWWASDTLLDQTTQWYVPGIGEVRLEQRDGEGRPVMTVELITNTRLSPDIALSLPLDELLPADTGPGALFREGPGRPGAVPDAALAGPDLRVTYRRQSGVGVTASPVYADGLFYLANQDGQLVALDAYQASPRWQFTAGGAIVAAPAVAGGIVYVGAADKRLYALEAQDGHFLWQRRLLDNVSTSPIVADGIVYAGAEDRRLYAFDARTGATRWSFLAADRLVSSPAIAEGRVVFGGDDGLVYALDAATGDLLWRFALDAAVEATPAIHNGQVFAASNGQQVVAIDLATGKAQWTATTRFGYLASPAVGETLVYVADTGGGLHAYEQATGRLSWEWFTPDEADFVSSPLLIGQHLVGIDANAQLRVWDAASGALLHTISVGSTMTASPTWTGDALLVANGAGELLALQGGPDVQSLSWDVRWQNEYAGREETLEASSFYADPLLVADALLAVLRGGRLWSIDPDTGNGAELENLGEEVWGTPVERNGVLYIAASSGRVYAYEIATGEVLWTAALNNLTRFGPAVDDQHVYVHTLGSPQPTVSALDVNTGDVVWEIGLDDGNSTPVRHGDSLYVSGTAIRALDPATGDVRWESEPLVALGTLGVFNGVVYAGDGDDQGASFLAVDAATGETLWRREDTAHFQYGRPAFDPATNTVLAGTQAGMLFAFAADTGEVRWQFQADAALQTTLHVREDVVFFTSFSGNLYAVDVATGRLRNHFQPGTSIITRAGPALGPDAIYTVKGTTLYALTLGAGGHTR